MNNKKPLIIVIAGVLFAGIAAQYAWGAGCAPGKSGYEFQKGMCYTTWRSAKYSTPESDASLKELARTGAKWVAILTTWYQERCSTTKVFPTANTPTDESIIHAIKTAHSLGMKVMIKPHLDLIDLAEGSWRGEIACVSETDWKAWFESYGDFILHYAKIAEENKVEMLCIGTELTSVATLKDGMWIDFVIKPVRDAYKGSLTYAANWNTEYSIVPFWQALDYVGIDAYFPLSENINPPLEEIRKGWEQWTREIEAFHKKVNKPIVFTEVGYCSADGTTRTPWEEIADGGGVNLKLQADCYRALFETFWDKEWFYGVYWWRWGTDVRFGGPNNKGFSPQNKPARQVIADWYKKPTPKRSLR